MAEAIRGDAAKDVEFWNQINEQAETRRHMRTPVHVHQHIMEAIPNSTPATTESRWEERELHIRTGALLLFGAAAAGLGALAALLLLR